MKSLTEIFPRASQSFITANSATLSHLDNKNDSTGIVGSEKGKRGTMNKTETEFSMILEARKRAGEILRYEFEGITLRFAGVKYTPDFVVLDTLLTDIEAPVTVIKFIEIKGAYTKGKFERAVERFRHAKTYWPEFTFELWQRQKGGEWKHVI